MNISWEMYRWETTVGIEFGIQALQRSIEEDARTWEMMRMSWRELEGASVWTDEATASRPGGSTIFHYGT